MPKRRLIECILVLIVGLVTAQSVSSQHQPAESGNKVNESLSIPQVAPSPANNPLTPDKAALGRQLFFDPRLSGDNSVSCATCHLPDKALTDGLPRGKGTGGKELTRNTPTLLNVGFYTAYFWDGRAGSLEEQALVPIQSLEEMNQDLDALEKELNAIPGYVAQFEAAFESRATRINIAKALATFQRTLVSRNSPFDRYLAGDKNALSEDAQRGWELFQGDAGCIRCHNGPNFTDSKFYRLGTAFRDRGRGAITGEKRDNYAFRTPGLRDVARTAPYMHDGSMQTLYQVVEFYYRGVPSSSPDGLPLDVAPLLGQSYSEISAIVAFLESLSGDSTPVSPPSLP
jgi:cytochrome c peroxidase